MSLSIMCRVQPRNYATWIKAYEAAREGRRQFGITDGAIYQDCNEPNALLIHLYVEDLEIAHKWFSSPRFQQGMTEAGTTAREFWVAERETIRLEPVPSVRNDP